MWGTSALLKDFFLDMIPLSFSPFFQLSNIFLIKRGLWPHTIRLWVFLGTLSPSVIQISILRLNVVLRVRDVLQSGGSQHGLVFTSLFFEKVVKVFAGQNWRIYLKKNRKGPRNRKIKVDHT